MNALNWPTLIIAALFTGLTGLAALPLIILVINPGMLRSWFLDPSEGERLISRSTRLRDQLQELRSLGFQLMGVKVEKLPLWGPTLGGVELSSYPADTFASIPFKPNGTPAGLFFYTPFVDGGMVFTNVSSSFFLQAEGDNISVKNISSSDLEEVFANHHQRVLSFQERGLTPFDVYSNESRIEATHHFYTSNYGRWASRFVLLRSPLIWAYVISLVILISVWISGRAQTPIYPY